jgi:predicted esterase
MYIKYQFKIYVSVFCLICISIISCSTDYPDIKSLSIQKGEITFEGVNKDQIKTTFVCSVPEQYNPQQSWPLLIALHGSGSNADAFLELFKPVTDTLGFVLVALQGGTRTEEGFGWRWDINAERALLTCMHIVQKQINVDSRKIFLLGFSSGGRLAYEVGMKNSSIFKGFALLSAPLDSNYQIQPARQLKHMRVVIAHGEYEKKYQVETQNLVQQLTDRCEAVKYEIFENTGHGLPEPKEEIIKEILGFLLNSP